MYPSTLTSIALVIAKSLEDYGVDYRVLFEKAGLDISRIHDYNARYPFSGMTQLWNLSSEATNDPCFGLYTIKYWHPTTLHAFGYAWLASNTVKEALERTVRYIRIVNSAANATLEENAEGYIFQIDTDYNNSVVKQSMVGMDAGFAIIIHMCRLLYGNDFSILRIEMKHSGFDCIAKYTQFFDAQIIFNSSHNKIVFHKNNIEKQLPTSNALLAHTNDNIVSNYLSNMDENDVVMRIKSYLVDNLSSGNVTEKKACEFLNLSQRSLQRKLEDKNVRFKDLLNNTRKDLALLYVKENHMSLTEITYLLGFSKQSNFSRAFKRWTGSSPKQYRQAV